MNIVTYDFEKDTRERLKGSHYTSDWPVVYLLENKKDIYVGETYNAKNRLKQHYDNIKKRDLTKAHIIIDDEFNKSATQDIESWLIQYIAADNKLNLRNGNGGLSNHNYYDRDKYKAKFELIWEELKKINIASDDLVQLRNTDLFKYSPYKALTDEQIQIVKNIKLSLGKNPNQSFIVNGEPGTGKSVLGTYLVKYLLSENKNLKIALVVPMTSLRSTLKKVFSKVSGLKSSMVIGPNEVVKDKYDLLIVDEAHRLRRRLNLTNFASFDKVNRSLGLDNNGNQLDWIIKSSKAQVLLYDEKQSIVPGDIRENDIKKIGAKTFKLSSQLRVMAGSDYIQHIDNILNSKNPSRKEFNKYEVKYFDNLNEMINLIKFKDKLHGLARIVAGYSWTWQTKKPNSVDYDIELDGLKLKWNSTNVDWVNSPNALNEVGCIHTVQGYDLNYIGVIIGPEVSFDFKNNKIVIDKNKYKDFNGKRSLENPDELEVYIKNIYKTLLTRGIMGTYIHAVDTSLAKYLKVFFNY